MAEKPKLRQNLRRWQIFFIAISAVIGGGIFNNDGTTLEVAGPGGSLLALLVIGIISIAVMEGVSEFTQLFPAPNAIVEYVKAFVDEDFGWVVGIAYWYTYSAIYATQNLAAANLSRYWGLSQTWQTVIFYFFAPATTVAINFVGVGTFGVVETVGGLLKIILVFGSAILMYVIAGHEGNGSKSGPINDGFKNNEVYAMDHGTAVCYVIPLIAYSFLGIEVVAVTAFEAESSKSLRRPSQIIAYITFLLYLLCLLGELLNIQWTNRHLPSIYNGVGDDSSKSTAPDNPSSTSMLIIAIWQAGFPKALAGFTNGCLIFSVLSASNTSLYVASRTLYGMARDIPKTNWLGRQMHKMSLVVPKTGVPAAALILSAISFFWLPFIQLKKGYAVQYLIEIMAVSASVACLIVWAALSLAFIRYTRWLKKCDYDIARDMPEYRRNSKDYKPYTVFAFAQPGAAWVGLIGCFLVFAFTSATWWNSKVTFSKVAVAYAAPVILLPLWILFKIINRRWWIKTGNDIAVLSATLRRLKWYKPDEERLPNSTSEPLRDLSPRPITGEFPSPGSEQQTNMQTGPT